MARQDEIHYEVRRTTEPASEPVTRAEALAHAHVDAGDEDDWFDNAIEAARRAVEDSFLGRTLIETSLTMTADEFPDEFRPPGPPLIEVTSLSYIDTDGDSQTLTEDTDYTVDDSSEPGRVYPCYNEVWPTSRDQPNAVTLVYKAGYGDEAADVPAGIKTAIKMLVTHWYQNRAHVAVGTITKEIESTIHAVLGPFKAKGVW